MDATPWLRRLDPAARLRLICLPFAGGGTADYRSWSDGLPGSVDVCPVVLPGRESRLRERPHDAMETLIAAMVDPLAAALRRIPYAIYGHSMGAWIGYELARALRQRGVAPPVHLFVAARRAPHLPSRRALLSELPDAEFVDGIQERYQAIPAQILASQELMELFLPTLRGDFTLLDRYRWSGGDPLGIPITALYGRQDTLVAREDVLAWREHTTGPFDVVAIAAGHFFLREAPDDVTGVVGGVLRRHLM